MSYIIDQFAGSAFWSCPNFNRPLAPRSSYLSKGFPAEVRKESLLSCLAKLRTSVAVLEMEERSVVVAVRCSRELPVVVRVRQGAGGRTYVWVRVVRADGGALGVGSRARRLLFCKLMAARLTATTFQQFKIIVGMGNGEVMLQYALSLLGDTTGGALERFLQHTVGSLADDAQLEGPMALLKQFCSPEPGLQRAAARRLDEPRIRKLYYYSQFSNVFINLTLDSNNEERSIIEGQKHELDAIAALKANFISPQCSALSLYSTFDPMALRRDMLTFDLSVLEREQIISLTAQPKHELPLWRSAQMGMPYVLSHIRLTRKLQQSGLRELSVGGFSRLLVGEMHYQYVTSYRQQGVSEPIKGVSPQRSLIVVKRDLPHQRRSRVAHEKFVLRRIKSGMFKFLPKFYVVDEPGCPFEQDLLMEYVPFPNLYEYMVRRQETLTLQSKLFLLHALAQAMRYLQDYRIAHLDLKPANVMLWRGLTVKLIDFGEAYHPDVKDYTPGFTAPYSAPENVFRPPTYNYKNDVFSLGVILHECLFARFPFYLFDEDLKGRVYAAGRVHAYWLWAPEEGGSWGEAATVPVLQLLIGKCLSGNPLERPELEWIVYLLRRCIDLMWS